MKPEELAALKARVVRGETLSQTEVLRLIWAAEEAASVGQVARLLRLGEAEFDRAIQQRVPA